MSADPENRKSPCCLADRTGADSRKNLNLNVPSNPALSIPLIDPALVRCRWDEEDRRLEKLWKDTGREIHRLALERHRAGVKEATGRICE
jgi:hypothetical protein